MCRFIENIAFGVSFITEIILIISQEVIE